MPGDHLKKVRSGEDFEFLARVYNLLMDLLADDRRGGGAIMDGPIVSKFGASVIQIKNGSGGNLPRHSILGFNGTSIDPTSDHLEGFAERIALIGRTPSMPADAGRWAILLQPLASNEIGYAVASGACPVQVNIVNSSDTFAEAINGDNSKLGSAASGGAPILYKESGTGLKWAVVRVGNNGGGVDLLNNDVSAVTQTPFVNIKGNGTEDILEFVADSVSSVAGGAQRLKQPPGPNNYTGIYWVGTKWVFDYLRVH